MESKLADSEAKKARLKEQVAAASVGREESEEREQLLRALQEKRQLRKKLTDELEKYKSCDPERMKELRKYVTVSELLDTMYHGVCKCTGTLTCKLKAE